MAKCRTNLVSHYRSHHKSVRNDVRDEHINIVMKKSIPIRKDGTKSTDVKLIDEIRTVKDGRAHKKKCMYCYHVYSYFHFTAMHLNLNSSARCSEIRDEHIEGLLQMNRRSGPLEQYRTVNSQIFSQLPLSTCLQVIRHTVQRSC